MNAMNDYSPPAAPAAKGLGKRRNAGRTHLYIPAQPYLFQL